MQKARENEITKEMRRVAEKEKIDVEILRRGIAKGEVIIPANINHTSLDPIAIGKGVTTKINANIGASKVRASIDEELEKVELCMEYGADTAMDLSTGGNLNKIREAIIAKATIPIGTVPTYQVVEEKHSIDELKVEGWLDVIELQARQGVDYMTIHAGILRRMLPLTDGRITGVVSRGGSILMRWMIVNKKENPLYTHFDEILEIAQRYDVTISLGDSLRPGCLHDATDEAQIAELKVLGELVLKCREHDVQCMVEGPGHIPMHQIKINVELEKKYCHNAPFYVLGPLVTDISPGYDHISSAIGAAMAGYYGADYLCYVTPKEHLGLPSVEDVKQGIVAYKIAAHAADIAKGVPNARDRDDELSRARYSMDWEKQFSLALDPETARTMRTKDLSLGADFCSMCGPDFCSMRLDNRTRKRKTLNEESGGTIIPTGCLIEEKKEKVKGK